VPQVHPVISPSKARNSAALSVVNGENGHSMNHPWQAAAKFPDTLSPGRLTAGPDPIAGTGGAALRRRFPGGEDLAVPVREPVAERVSSEVARQITRGAQIDLVAANQ